MFLSSLIILYPLGLIFVGALKDKRGAAQMTYTLPDKLHLFDNIRTVLESGNVAVGFQNSVVVGAAMTALTIVCAGLAAFVIQRRKSAVTKLVFSVFVLGIIVPPNVIGQFRLVRAIGMYGSLAGVILLETAGMLPVIVFLFVGYFKSIPRDIDESAVLDGCPALVFYWKVMMPLAAPIMSTCVVIAFMTSWNNFITPLYFLTNSDGYTLPLSVFYFVGQYSTDWNLVFTDVFLISLPVLAVYLFLQRYIISGLTKGAVKA
jgi:raffinose/stachyose/melibiose transport system permease protein